MGNSDIKWGGCVTKTDAKKPSHSCECKKIEDIPYTIIKYFKEFSSYPDKASWPADKKCWGKKVGIKKAAKFVDDKVTNMMETLSNEVKGTGYDGEYTHEDRRRNRVLYAIPYTGKWWGNFRHKATEARRRNLQKTKRATSTYEKVQLTKKHQRKLAASSIGVESDMGGVSETGVVAGKKDGVSSQNENKEVHANTFEVNSVSPDGLSKVTRQVADVVSTTTAVSELHQSQTQILGKKLTAQKSNSVQTTEDSGESLGTPEDQDEDGDSEDDEPSSEDEEEEEEESDSERKAAKNDEDSEDDDDDDEDEDDDDLSDDIGDKERSTAKTDSDLDEDAEESEDSDNGSDNDSDSDEEIRELVSEDIKNDLRKSSNKKSVRKLAGNGFSFDQDLKYDLSKIFGKGKFEDSIPDAKQIEKLVNGETKDILKELGQVKSAKILGAVTSLLLAIIYLN